MQSREDFCAYKLGLSKEYDGQAKLAAWQILFHCRDAEETEAAASLEGVCLAAQWPKIPISLRPSVSRSK